MSSHPRIFRPSERAPIGSRPFARHHLLQCALPPLTRTALPAEAAEWVLRVVDRFGPTWIGRMVRQEAIRDLCILLEPLCHESVPDRITDATLREFIEANVAMNRGPTIEAICAWSDELPMRAMAAMRLSRSEPTSSSNALHVLVSLLGRIPTEDLTSEHREWLTALVVGLERSECCSWQSANRTSPRYLQLPLGPDDRFFRESETYSIDEIALTLGRPPTECRALLAEHGYAAEDGAYPGTAANHVVRGLRLKSIQSPRTASGPKEAC